MADFEDSTSPTWRNLLAGQRRWRRGARRPRITAANGKHYALALEQQAVLIVRPRGWHLDEKHVLIDGQPIAGGLFDAAVFAFHNARAAWPRTAARTSTCPSCSRRRGRAVGSRAVAHGGMLGLPHGQMKVTVLIETLPAVFEMDEILHALRTASSA
jgi:malate synthase